MSEALRLAEAETPGSKGLAATLEVVVGTVKAGRRSHPAQAGRGAPTSVMSQTRGNKHRIGPPHRRLRYSLLTQGSAVSASSTRRCRAFGSLNSLPQKDTEITRRSCAISIPLNDSAQYSATSPAWKPSSTRMIPSGSRMFAATSRTRSGNLSGVSSRRVPSCQPTAYDSGEEVLPRYKSAIYRATPSAAQPLSRSHHDSSTSRTLGAVTLRSGSCARKVYSDGQEFG